MFTDTAFNLKAWRSVASATPRPNVLISISPTDIPSAHVERVLRDYYAGKLGEADLEDRLLRDVDERQFRAICQNALEGLAAKKLNLAMLVERRALAQERRVVPETIARFLHEAAEYAKLNLKTLPSLPHAFEPGRTPAALHRYEREPDWRLPAIASKYPRCSTDREVAEKHKLEWVTPGHPLFEAMRRHTASLAVEDFRKGACFHSLQHEQPARIDFYRARVVDGLGQVIHERLFAVELTEGKEPISREPGQLGNFIPIHPPETLPAIALDPEATSWLQSTAFGPFLEETRKERLAEVERIASHVEMSLTELLQKADEEIGRAAADVEKKLGGAEGREAQAETRHAELLVRRDRRRQEMEQQRSLWNRLGTRILPKLRAGTELQVGVEFSVTVPNETASSFAAELRQILSDLGLSDTVHIE